MEPYELTPEQITTWAVEYATYEDLEAAAKALYNVYGSRRKQEHPEQAKKAKQYKKYLKQRK